MTILNVNQNDENQTIFNFLKKNFKTTKLSIIYKWFRTNKIKLNNKKVKDQKLKLKAGDEIKVYDSSQSVLRDEFVMCDFSSLDIIFEDENILIIDKNHNVEMHSQINPCLDNMVKTYLIRTKQYSPEEENSFVVSHVHRLDKLTAGLVIYAKNKKTLDVMLLAIQNKMQIQKYYQAILVNDSLPEGLVEGFILYDSEKQKSVYSEIEKPGYKSCQQISKLVDKLKYTYEIQLLSGRKHQIRAICSFFKAPIVGDFRYGAEKTGVKAIGLVASKLRFENFENDLAYLNGKEFLSKKRV